MLDESGRPLPEEQEFASVAISVVDAHIRNMTPDIRFVERMQLKQKTSADRVIAREQLIQEEEQRLLAIARGEREVAERQAMAKVERIQKTTDAETEKLLALTRATKVKEQAEIEIRRLWPTPMRGAVPNKGVGSDGGTPTGSDREVRAFMQLLTLDAAQRRQAVRKVTRRNKRITFDWTRRGRWRLY